MAQPLHDKLAAQWGPRANWPCPPDDLVRVLLEIEVSDVTETGFRDRFGCQWVRHDAGYVFADPPVSEPDASMIPRVELVPDEDIERIRQARADRPDAFLFYQFTFTLNERLWTLRGFEQALMDYLTEPSYVDAALDVLMEMHWTALDKLLASPIDCVSFGDDYGTQKGLIFSRDVFRRFLKPRLAQLYERVRSAGKIVGQHSCGDNTELMGEFIDIGLQIFHPVQPEAMDIATIKREFGRHLALRGGIGTQGDIIFGTPDQARAVVRDAVKVLSDGGGYLIEPAKPFPAETPVANIMAVIDEMTRVMNYEFG